MSIGAFNIPSARGKAKTRYPNADIVCTGDGRRMNIFVTDAALKDEIVPFISGKTKLHNSAFRVCVIDSIPRNEYGKVKFAELEAAQI